MGVEDQPEQAVGPVLELRALSLRLASLLLSDRVLRHGPVASRFAQRCISGPAPDRVGGLGDNRDGLLVVRDVVEAGPARVEQRQTGAQQCPLRGLTGLRVTVRVLARLRAHRGLTFTMGLHPVHVDKPVPRDHLEFR